MNEMSLYSTYHIALYHSLKPNLYEFLNVLINDMVGVHNEARCSGDIGV
jgi:hypothetical protein